MRIIETYWAPNGHPIISEVPEVSIRFKVAEDGVYFTAYVRDVKRLQKDKGEQWQ